MVSFILTGVLCTFVALCYAELASALPVSGSAYSYTYTSMGEVVAWIMGLLLLLEYGLAASTVAVGWSGYFVRSSCRIWRVIVILRGLEHRGSDQGRHRRGDRPRAGEHSGDRRHRHWVTSLLVVGVSESATVNNIVVFIKLSVVIAFIGIGSFYVHPALWYPLVPAQICRAARRGTPMEMGPTDLALPGGRGLRLQGRRATGLAASSTERR